jgi:hypothetical protein
MAEFIVGHQMYAQASCQTLPTRLKDSHAGGNHLSDDECVARLPIWSVASPPGRSAMERCRCQAMIARTTFC